MDFKIFSSVLAALLVFALIVAGAQAIERHREQKALERFLLQAQPHKRPLSVDDALRNARLSRDRHEVSITEGLRMAREGKKSPDQE